MSEVLAFLRPLGLERYHSMFEDEAITEVDLLRSMGEAMLRESMEELGMQAAHTEKLARALFPSGSGGVPLDDNDDDDLVLEDQDDDDDGLVLEDQDVANPADEDDEDDDELELEELNDRVPPNEYYERGLELQDDAPMVIDYRNALNTAFIELTEELRAEGDGASGEAVLRTPKGAKMVVQTFLGTNFEKVVCLAERSGSTLRAATGPVAVKLWHMRSDWRDEGDDTDAIAERMRRRAKAEHERIRRLAGCRHWLQLVADIASENAARVGGEEYAALFLEYFPGKDLTELIVVDHPPPGVVGWGMPAGEGQSANDDDDDDDDDDDGDTNPKAVERRAAWEAAKGRLTPEQLRTELQAIKDFAIGTLRGMREAHEAGLRFEPDGSEGPFLGDVLRHEGKVKLVDTESLGEYDEGEDRRFTAEPLVYSPLGEFVRSWWNGMSAKLGMAPNTMCKDPAYQKVLDQFGTLNWLLFKWEPPQLQGDEILRLLTHGPEAAAAAAPDPALEARWSEFMQRAFVMLGPARFDEIKECTAGLQSGEIPPETLVARTRFVMGREFEGLHAEYITILMKLGYALKL